MKRVEIKLNLDAVAPLLDVMKSAADELEPALAIEQHVPEQGADLAADWKRELLQGQKSDLTLMLALFDREFFSTGVIALDPSNSEQILRACSAIRLRLRDAHLKGIEDENLEAGEISMDALPEIQQRAFAAYVFLATLQEVIVQHLDPTVLE